MRLFYTYLLTLIVGYSLPIQAVELGDLTYYTESYPPYNFEENGFLRGIAIDLLLASTAKSKQPVRRTDIELVPWPRGYHQLTIGPNIVLFSTTRTKMREPLFKWAGPIAKTRVVLLAKRGRNIEIKEFKDALQYSVGAIRDDVGAQMAIANGYPSEKIYYAADGDSLAKQLEFARIDLWVYDEAVARWFIKRNGLNGEDFLSVFALSEGDLYYAFSKDVPDETVKVLQDNIDRVKSTPGRIGNTLYDDFLFQYF